MPSDRDRVRLGFEVAVALAIFSFMVSHCQRAPTSEPHPIARSRGNRLRSTATCVFWSSSLPLAESATSSCRSGTGANQSLIGFPRGVQGRTQTTATWPVWSFRASKRASFSLASVLPKPPGRSPSNFSESCEASQRSSISARMPLSRGGGKATRSRATVFNQRVFLSWTNSDDTLSVSPYSTGEISVYGLF